MKVQDTLNKDIVLFALYELGGAKEPIHTEDIAYQVFQYPTGRQRYRWERYQMYPDKGRIARELHRLKNWKGTSFVKGHVNIGARKDRVDGWMLTSAGVERVKALEERLIQVVQTPMGDHSVYQIEDFRQRIVHTTCYKMYLKDQSLADAKEHDFTDMLFCLPDAPKNRIRSAYNELLANARAVDAADLLAFLQAAGKRFKHLLTELEEASYGA